MPQALLTVPQPNLQRPLSQNVINLRNTPNIQGLEARSQTTRRVGNWTHVLSVFCVHILDIGCETHGFGKQFSSWYSPCHCVLAFFVRFAMFSAFMSFQNQRLFFAVFLKYAGFSTFLRAFFLYRQGQSSRLDSLIQDFGSLLKQAGSSVFPSPLPGPAMLDQSRVISVSFLRSKKIQ